MLWVFLVVIGVIMLFYILLVLVLFSDVLVLELEKYVDIVVV